MVHNDPHPRPTGGKPSRIVAVLPPHTPVQTEQPNPPPSPTLFTRALNLFEKTPGIGRLVRIARRDLSRRVTPVTTEGSGEPRSGASSGGGSGFTTSPFSPSSSQEDPSTNTSSGTSQTAGEGANPLLAKRAKMALAHVERAFEPFQGVEEAPLQPPEGKENSLNHFQHTNEFYEIHHPTDKIPEQPKTPNLKEQSGIPTLGIKDLFKETQKKSIPDLLAALQIPDTAAKELRSFVEIIPNKIHKVLTTSEKSSPSTTSSNEQIDVKELFRKLKIALDKIPKDDHLNRFLFCQIFMKKLQTIETKLLELDTQTDAETGSNRRGSWSQNSATALGNLTDTINKELSVYKSFKSLENSFKYDVCLWPQGKEFGDQSGCFNPGKLYVKYDTDTDPNEMYIRLRYLFIDPNDPQKQITGLVDTTINKRYINALTPAHNENSSLSFKSFLSTNTNYLNIAVKAIEQKHNSTLTKQTEQEEFSKKLDEKLKMLEEKAKKALEEKAKKALEEKAKETPQPTDPPLPSSRPGSSRRSSHSGG